MKSNRETESDVRLYKAYLAEKGKKGKGDIRAMAHRLGITRTGLYDFVRLVEHGDSVKIRRCAEKSRMDCIWKHKYEIRFLAIPKGDAGRLDGKAVLALQAIIKEMHEDKFPTLNIAVRLGKDRSTVLHHLRS